MSKYSLGRIEAIIAQLQSADDAGREKYLNHLKTTEPELLVEVLRFMRDTGDSSLEDLGDRIREAVTPGTALIGRTIKQYTIEEVIGVGGMGVVYKARDSKLKVNVALKFLPERLRDDETARERFMREAQAVARIDHRNICAIYSVEETKEGVPFLSMRLYEGETLRDRLERGSLTYKEAKDILSQTAAGLSAAHKKGLIHRDIKPENLFITNSGSVKILDFGIAAATDDSRISTDEGMVGTVAYMSPEQTIEEPDAVTVKSDLWALGAVGYEMVTGRPPFDAEDRQAIVKGILEDEPPELPKKTPKPLVRVIRKCLRKDPSKRISSAWHVETFLKRTPSDHKPVAAMVAVIVAALVLGWLVRDFADDPTRWVKPVAGPTIFVSPFELSPESQKYDSLASGMYEDLLISLRKLENVNVRRARINDIDDPGQFLREADADFLLSGRLFEESGTSTLSLDLFSDDENQDSYVHEVEFEQYSLQNSLSQIMDRLALAITLEGRPDNNGTISTAAYIEYLLGLNLLKMRTPREVIASQRLFLNAIAIDSTFSEAYARLSLAMALSVSTAYSADPDPTRFDQARSVAERAIALDPTNAAAHTALAFVYHEREWEWEEAGNHFEMALELNRDDATTFHLYATHLAELDKLEEALQLQLHAIELEPGVPIYHANYAQLLYFDEQCDVALQHLNNHTDVLGDFFLGHVWRSLCLLKLGRVDQAESAINDAIGPQPTMNPLLLAFRGMILGRYSDDHIYEAIRDIEGKNVPVLVALLYGEIGQYDRSLEYLRRGFDQRDVYMTVLKVWPGADPIRDRQEFQRIMKEMNLDD